MQHRLIRARADDIGDLGDNGMAEVEQLVAAHYAGQVRVVYRMYYIFAFVCLS